MHEPRTAFRGLRRLIGEPRIIQGVAIAGGVAAALLMASYSKGAQAESEAEVHAQAEAPKIEPRPAPLEVQPSRLTLPGRVVANSDLDIRAKVGGQVVSLSADVSDRVRKGDVLLALDPADEQRAVTRATIALKSSEARLAQAKQILVLAEKSLCTGRERAEAAIKAAAARAERARIRADRLKATVAMNITSKEEYDSRAAEATEASANLDMIRVQAEEIKDQELALDVKKQDVLCAAAQVELDEVALATARQRLQDTRIVAPIDGVVVQRNVQPGQIITPGTGAPLFTLSDHSRMFVVAMVKEKDVASIQLCDQVSISSDAVPNKHFQGAITRIASRGTRNGDAVSFEVRAEVLDPNMKLLRPEMTAKLEIGNGE